MTSQYQYASLEVVPSQNDFDSGPRKSCRIDLPRRARTKKYRSKERIAVNITVSVLESILLGRATIVFSLLADLAAWIPNYARGKLGVFPIPPYTTSLQCFYI